MHTPFLTSFFKAGVSMATLAALLCTGTAQAQTARRRTSRKARPAATAPAARTSSQTVVGDYVVAMVNSDPVTNFEVNQHARELMQQLSREKNAQAPAREVLLNQALREVILQKAAIQSVRDTTLSLSDDEFANAERQLAAESQLPVADFRHRVMKERRLTEAQYRKELSEQLLLSKMREMRTSMAADKVTELDAVHWLRSHDTGKLSLTESRARHILLPASDEASARQAMAKLADVRKRIASGRLDFAAAAREMSQDGSAAHGGDLGWAPEGAFVPEFQQQINALTPGAMSQPFASRFGVHLVQLLDRRETAMTQEQKIAAARNILRQEKAEEALRKWESEVRAQAYIEMREAPR